MKRFLLTTITPLDFSVWLFVLIFFCGSSLISGGNTPASLFGALGIILEMVLIAGAIEIIIESLKNTKGIGTLTGFITNGPEAVCLIVGLFAGDMIFAASTPLGSNFMNPLLLVIAALIRSSLLPTISTRPGYSLPTIILTALLAGSFFLIPESYYLPWTITALLITSILFIIRPPENENDPEEPHSFQPKIWLFPAIGILTVSGYFLDPVVTYTATHSHAPKGVIGFVVLATLTSWPEFKSCLSLYRRGKVLSAILNITVSNITNIWLALVGTTLFLWKM